MKYKMKSIYLAIKIEVLFLVGIFFISINLYAATKNQSIEVNIAQAKVINVPDVIGAVGHIRAIQQVNLSFGNSGKLQEKFFNNWSYAL